MTLNAVTQSAELPGENPYQDLKTVTRAAFFPEEALTVDEFNVDQEIQALQIERNRLLCSEDPAVIKAQTIEALHYLRDSWPDAGSKFWKEGVFWPHLDRAVQFAQVEQVLSQGDSFTIADNFQKVRLDHLGRMEERKDESFRAWIGRRRDVRNLHCDFERTKDGSLGLVLQSLQLALGNNFLVGAEHLSAVLDLAAANSKVATFLEEKDAWKRRNRRQPQRVNQELSASLASLHVHRDQLSRQIEGLNLVTEQVSPLFDSILDAKTALSQTVKTAQAETLFRVFGDKFAEFACGIYSKQFRGLSEQLDYSDLFSRNAHIGELEFALGFSKSLEVSARESEPGLSLLARSLNQYCAMRIVGCERWDDLMQKATPDLVGQIYGEKNSPMYILNRLRTIEEEKKAVDPAVDQFIAKAKAENRTVTLEEVSKKWPRDWAPTCLRYSPIDDYTFLSLGQAEALVEKSQNPASLFVDLAYVRLRILNSVNNDWASSSVSRERMDREVLGELRGMKAALSGSF